MCGVVRLICECGYMREGEREREFKEANFGLF